MSSNNDPLRNQELLPIVLGITGHRDIPQMDFLELEALLEAEIGKLKGSQGKYPHSPFAAISPLAEGADRLFARVVLKLGIPLYVPLPLPVDEYRKDFKTPDSLEDFNELLNRATQVFTLPQTDPTCGQDICGSWYRRELQYARVGVYLAQRSHILFALWDGQTQARGLGGTAQVAAFHLLGQFNNWKESLDKPGHSLCTNCKREMDGFPSPREWLIATTPLDRLDGPNTGYVCHIPVRRLSAMNATRGSVEWGHKWIEKDGHIAWDQSSTPYADALLRELDQFNAEIRKQPPPEKTTPPSMIFGVVDSLAFKAMGNNRKYLVPIISLIGLNEIVQEVMPDSLPRWLSLLFGLCTQIIVLYLVWRLHHKFKTHDAVDRRAIAEGLRVQGFWSQAGIQDAIALRYLRHDHQELAWVHRALLGSALPKPSSMDGNDCHAATQSDIDRVRKHWIKDQVHYFERKLQQFRRYQYLGKLGTVLFFTGLVAGFAGLFFLDLPAANDRAVGDILLANSLLPGLAILLFTYLRFGGFSDDAADYMRAKAIFESADRRLKAVLASGDSLTERELVAQQQSILHQLGIEALQEHARWAHRHKNLELEYAL